MADPPGVPWLRPIATPPSKKYTSRRFQREASVSPAAGSASIASE
jgi:hypothetical protein